MFSSMIGAAKARNPLSHRRLRDFPGSKTGPKTRFDHINDHRQQKTKQPYPGIAQLVARVVWDHQVGGSSPSTRTILKLELIRVRINSNFLHYQLVFDKENDSS